MRLRAFVPDTDFERIRGWISDERTHAMWCADRFPYPLEKKSFLAVLSDMAKTTGEIPLVAAMDDDTAEGFFCYCVNSSSGDARIKFVVVAPERRGKGTACEMLRLFITFAFGTLDLESVSLGVFSVNPRAKKCYEKVGFSVTGTDQDAFACKEELWDRCGMEIRRSDRAG